MGLRLSACGLRPEAASPVKKDVIIMSEVLAKDYTDYFKGRDWVHMLGFYAKDWRKFMTDHNRIFGSGPLFYNTNPF